MIRAVFNENQDNLNLTGLTQWDYGQELRIIGLENLKKAEVHFSSGNSAKAPIVPAEILEDGSISAHIPDKLLESGENIKAYVYVTDMKSGETVRTMTLFVKRRAKPEDYNSPAEKNLLRQVLDKLDVKADGIDFKDGELFLKSGNMEIGPRIRLPTNDREIELKNNGAVIQWRYTDSNEWTDLANLEELSGPAGETPEFEIREGHLFAIYKEEKER